MKTYAPIRKVLPALLLVIVPAGLLAQERETPPAAEPPPAVESQPAVEPSQAPRASREGYLDSRVRILAERLELTTQLGDLEVESLKREIQRIEPRLDQLREELALREQSLAAAEERLAHAIRLHEKGFTTASNLEEERLGVGSARSGHGEVRTQLRQLELERDAMPLAVRRREIEARLATTAIRLELLEAEYELATRRTMRERLGGGRDSREPASGTTTPPNPPSE